MDGDQSGCFTIAKSSFNLGDLKEGKKKKKKIPDGNQSFVETVRGKKKGKTHGVYELTQKQ